MTNRTTYATLKEAKDGAIKMSREKHSPCAVYTVATTTGTIYGVSERLLAMLYEPGRVLWSTN